MPSYQFGNISFYYSIQRSDKRRTVAIIIDPQAGVVVRTPSAVTENDLKDILKRKSPWIQRKLKDIENFPPQPPPKEYVSGESFQYLGRNHRLKVIPVENGEESVKLFQGRFIVHLKARQTNSGGRIKHLLERWCQRHAVERIAERVDIYAPDWM